MLHFYAMALRGTETTGKDEYFHGTDVTYLSGISNKCQTSQL